MNYEKFSAVPETLHLCLIVGAFFDYLLDHSIHRLHEVARELESPFINAPNDIPCNYFQAQFNEALMTTFTGYHPDAYWEVCETVEESTEKSDEVDVDVDDDETFVREVSKSSEPPKLPPLPLPLPSNQNETSEKQATEQES